MNRRTVGSLVVSVLFAGCTQGDPDDTRTERFVIENRSESKTIVGIEVRNGHKTILSGCYSCPPAVGLQFDHEFPWGEYTIRGRRESGQWLEHKWRPRSCAPTPHEDGTLHAGPVITADSAPELVVDQCDYIKLGVHYIEAYRSPDDYEKPC